MDNPPMQYTRGWVEFYKLRFKVTPDVLIPRPETELLVDEVLHIGRRLKVEGGRERITILDLGTGAGNIAISIAKNLEGIKIMASDISEPALKIARQNAKFHGVGDKIEFIKSDLIPDQVRDDRGDDDIIIVANLPYIPSERIPYLDSSVKNFEPHLALDGGKDGFELYRKLFGQMKQFLKQAQDDKRMTFLIAEIDYTHGELAANEALKFFPQAKVSVETDLAHKQRILSIIIGHES